MTGLEGKCAKWHRRYSEWHLWHVTQTSFVKLISIIWLIFGMSRAKIYEENLLFLRKVHWEFTFPINNQIYFSPSIFSPEKRKISKFKPWNIVTWYIFPLSHSIKVCLLKVTNKKRISRIVSVFIQETSWKTSFMKISKLITFSYNYVPRCFFIT